MEFTLEEHFSSLTNGRALNRSSSHKIQLESMHIIMLCKGLLESIFVEGIIMTTLTLLNFGSITPEVT